MKLDFTVSFWHQRHANLRAVKRFQRFLRRVKHLAVALVGRSPPLRGFEMRMSVLLYMTGTINIAGQRARERIIALD